MNQASHILFHPLNEAPSESITRRPSQWQVYSSKFWNFLSVFLIYWSQQVQSNIRILVSKELEWTVEQWRDQCSCLPPLSCGPFPGKGEIPWKIQIIWSSLQKCTPRPFYPTFHHSRLWHQSCELSVIDLLLSSPQLSNQSHTCICTQLLLQEHGSLYADNKNLWLSA